ncbi:hypothetical protein WJX74_007162 [Apatococcus lobatus]|uniref:SANT domain-containing protein n=1 Tax=Apatococcus lobatus TaxID=904363 RepID=A0AAW1QCS6_9CHLO
MADEGPRGFYGRKRDWTEQGYDRGHSSWAQAPGNKRGRFDGTHVREHGRGDRGPPPRDAPHFGGPPRFGHPMQKGPADRAPSFPGPPDRRAAGFDAPHLAQDGGRAFRSPPPAAFREPFFRDLSPRDRRGPPPAPPLPTVRGPYPDYAEREAGELTGGPLEGPWGPRQVGRRPPGWDPRMPPAGWDRNHPGPQAHPMGPMHPSQVARPMSPFDSSLRGPQDGALGDGSREWGSLSRDAVRESFLRPRGSPISPAQGRHTASLRSISPRRSSFAPRGSAEGWDGREGPPMPPRPLPMPPPLPAGNLSTPRNLPPDGRQLNPRSAPPSLRIGAERPFRSSEGTRGSGSRDRIASEPRRGRVSRSPSRSASPLKRRPDATSPAPASAPSSAQKGMSEPRSSGRAPSDGPAGGKQETVRVPAASLPGPPPMQRVLYPVSGPASGATSPSPSVRIPSKAFMALASRQPPDAASSPRPPKSSNAASSEAPHVSADTGSQGDLKPSPLRSRPSRFSQSPPGISKAPAAPVPSLAAPPQVTSPTLQPPEPASTGPIPHAHLATSQPAQLCPSASESKKAEAPPAHSSRGGAPPASGLIKEQHATSPSPLTPPTLAKGVAPGAVPASSPVTDHANEPLVVQDSAVNVQPEDGNRTPAGRTMPSAAEELKPSGLMQLSVEPKGSPHPMHPQPSGLSSGPSGVREKQAADAARSPHDPSASVSPDAGQSSSALPAALQSPPARPAPLTSADPGPGTVPLPVTSAEQPAPTEAAPKRKRLGWGQGLKRRESHPVLGQAPPANGKLLQPNSDAIPMLAGDDSHPSSVFAPSATKPRPPIDPNGDLQTAARPAQSRRDLPARLPPDPRTEGMAIPILAGDLGTPLPEPPSEISSPAGPHVLQTQVSREGLAQHTSAQAMGQPSKTLSDGPFLPTAENVPAMPERMAQESSIVSPANEETASPARTSPSANTIMSPAADSCAKDLEGSLEALKASLLAAKQSEISEAMPKLPSEQAPAGETVEETGRSESVPSQAGPIAEVKLVQPSDDPVAVSAEAMPIAAEMPADVPMMDTLPEEFLPDLHVPLPRPDHEVSAEKQDMERAAPSPSAQPVGHPASPVSPFAQPMSVTEQQQQPELARGAPAMSAGDGDEAGTHAGLLPSNSAASDRQVAAEAQPPDMKQEAAGVQAQQELQASRDRLLLDTQTLDARIADTSKQLEDLKQAQFADDAEIKAVQQQLDDLARPGKAPAAHSVADALSDAESSSMEDSVATNKGLRARARRSTLSVEAPAQASISANVNGEAMSPAIPLQDVAMEDVASPKAPASPVITAAFPAFSSGDPVKEAEAVPKPKASSPSALSDSSLRHALARAFPLKPDSRAERLPILARNMQHAAASDRAQLKLLPSCLVAELSLGPGRALRPFAFSPEHLPSYQSCLDEHIQNRPRLFQKMKEKRKALLLFQAYLALEYREKFNSYSSHLRGKQDAFKVASEPAKLLGRQTSRSKSGSGAVRSDYEEQLIMSQLQAAERMHSQLMVQEYVLDPAERERNRFISSNGRIEDPVKQLDLEDLSKRWTDAERKHFHEQFMLFPKDFFRISHALKELGIERSTGECVAFFYRTQKLDEFANVRRKQQLKKRRLQSDLNRSVTYMGMSSARRGDVLVTTAVRATRYPPPAEPVAKPAGRGFGRGGKLPPAVRPPKPVRGPLPPGDGAAFSMPPSPQGYYEPSGLSPLPLVAGGLPLATDRPIADDRAGGWSADEEQRFMEALRLCGKDMRGIAQQMGTRSMGAVKSFFNKHRKRLQLDKVLESRGSGTNEGRLGRGSSGMTDLPTPSASAGPSRQTSFSQGTQAAALQPFDPARLHRHPDVQADDAGDEDDGLAQGHETGMSFSRGQAHSQQQQQRGRTEPHSQPAVRASPYSAYPDAEPIFAQPQHSNHARHDHTFDTSVPESAHMAAIAARLGLGDGWRHHTGMPEQHDNNRRAPGATYGNLDQYENQHDRGPPPFKPQQSETAPPDAAWLPPGLLQLLNQEAAPDASAGLQQMMAQYLVSQHLSQQVEQSRQQQQDSMPSPFHDRQPPQHPPRPELPLGEADLASFGTASLPAFQSVLAALAASHAAARQGPAPPPHFPHSHFNPTGPTERLEVDRLAAAAPRADAYGMDQVSDAQALMQALGARAASEVLGMEGLPAGSQEGAPTNGNVFAPAHALLPPPRLGQLPAQQPLHNSLHPSGAFGFVQHDQGFRQTSPAPPGPLNPGLLPRSAPYQRPSYPQLPPYPGTPFPPALDPQGSLPDFPPLDHLPRQQHGSQPGHTQPSPAGQHLPTAFKPASFLGTFTSPADAAWAPPEARTGPLQQSAAQDRLQGTPSDTEHGPVDGPVDREKAGKEALQLERSSSEVRNVSVAGLSSAEPKPGEAGSNMEKKEEGEKAKKADAANKSASSWQEDEKAAFMETYKEYGRDWERLQKAIPNKKQIQIKNYYQNYKSKLGLERIELPPTAIHPASRSRRRSNPQSASDAPRSVDPAKSASSQPKSPPGSQPLQSFMSDVMAHLRQSTSTAGTQADGMPAGPSHEQQQHQPDHSQKQAPSPPQRVSSTQAGGNIDQVKHDGEESPVEETARPDPAGTQTEGRSGGRSQEIETQQQAAAPAEQEAGQQQPAGPSNTNQQPALDQSMGRHSMAKDLSDQQQDAADHQPSRSASPHNMLRQEPFGPHAGSSQASKSHPLPEKSPHEMAYLAALRHFGMSDHQAHRQGLPPAMQSRLTDPLMSSGPNEQELATLRLAEPLQQQHMPSVRSQPPTPHEPFPFHDPLAAQMISAADSRADTRQLPLFLQPNHAEAHPVAQQGDLTEDRFPHNPALDPFLSSLQQQHSFSVADQRAAVPRAPPQGGLPGFESSGYQEALRMRMDSPLYASNQAAAAAAAAAVDAAAQMEGCTPYHPPLLQGNASGSRHDLRRLTPNPGRDENPYEQSFTGQTAASSLQHHLQDHWPSRLLPRGPAEAAMQAALHAQLMQGVPLDDGMQQAMQAVAMHAEGDASHKAQVFNEESCRDALAAGRSPFADLQLPPSAGSLKNQHASKSQDSGSEMTAHIALLQNKDGQSKASLHTRPPAEHRSRSFIDQERSNAGIGRASSEQLELERLRKAAEWMRNQHIQNGGPVNRGHQQPVQGRGGLGAANGAEGQEAAAALHRDQLPGDNRAAEHADQLSNRSQPLAHLHDSQMMRQTLLGLLEAQQKMSQQQSDVGGPLGSRSPRPSSRSSRPPFSRPIADSGPEANAQAAAKPSLNEP